MKNPDEVLKKVERLCKASSDVVDAGAEMRAQEMRAAFVTDNILKKPKVGHRAVVQGALFALQATARDSGFTDVTRDLAASKRNLAAKVKAYEESMRDVTKGLVLDQATVDALNKLVGDSKEMASLGEFSLGVSKIGLGEELVFTPNSKSTTTLGAWDGGLKRVLRDDDGDGDGDGDDGGKKRVRVEAPAGYDNDTVVVAELLGAPAVRAGRLAGTMNKGAMTKNGPKFINSLLYAKLTAMDPKAPVSSLFGPGVDVVEGLRFHASDMESIMAWSSSRDGASVVGTKFKDPVFPNKTVQDSAFFSALKTGAGITGGGSPQSINAGCLPLFLELSNATKTLVGEPGQDPKPDSGPEPAPAATGGDSSDSA